MLNGSFGGDLNDDAYEMDDWEEPGSKPKRPGLPVEPRRVLGTLVEHRRLLLKGFVIASLVALIASFFVPRTYESSAQLLFEGTPVLDRGGAQATPGAFMLSAILPSRLREVRERLGWDLSLDELESRLDVVFIDGASMRIAAHAANPEDARSLAQAVIDVFLDWQARLNADRLALATKENEAAIAGSKQKREQANAAYEAFREKSGRPDLLREHEQLLKRAAELRSKANETAVEVASQRARLAELENAQRELPKQVVASATKGSPVDSPLAAARSELAAARASLSDQHPTVQALKERVANLQAQRKGETNELGEQVLAANPARVAVDQELVSSRAALAATVERESALRVLLEATEKEAASLAPDEAEARQILGELERANARVEELTRRAAVLADAALGPMTGFRVLAAPMLPEEPQRSSAHIVLLTAFPIVSLLILALVIIMRQLRELTVEAPREVAWWGNGPVLGTSAWPRDPAALEPFVNELEDHGVKGAGRTLVVPASEAEREIACAFAMRLAEAPWLAAAILDVGARSGGDHDASPLVTPAPVPRPDAAARPRRLSSEGTPSVAAGRVIVTTESKPSPTPAPPAEPEPSKPAVQGGSFSPPRKKTVIGLPAVQSSIPPQLATEPVASASQTTSSAPAPFRRKPGARATVRMIVPVTRGEASTDASAARGAATEEEAFLLTRPVPVTTEHARPESVVGVADTAVEPSGGAASSAVMRAAVRLLGNDENDLTRLRPSYPPARRALGEVAGVALAWNGPLSGPLLRRAARLAHRVMVVVSSGMSVIDLARVRTRLGRDEGVGYVLVNVSESYLDLPDRVGPVEEFWAASEDHETQDPRLS